MALNYFFVLTFSVDEFDEENDESFNEEIDESFNEEIDESFNEGVDESFQIEEYFLQFEKNKQKFIEIFGITLHPEAKKKGCFFVPGMVSFQNTLSDISTRDHKLKNFFFMQCLRVKVSIDLDGFIQQKFEDHKIEHTSLSFKNHLGLRPKEWNAQRAVSQKTIDVEAETLMVSNHNHMPQKKDVCCKDVSCYVGKTKEEKKIIELKPDADILYNPAQTKGYKEEKLTSDQKGIAHPNQVGLQMQRKTHDHLKDTEPKIYQILLKKKRFHKAQKAKDPVPNGLLEDILTDPRPEGTHALTWARFQLTCVLLTFGGFRVNEVASVSISRLNTLIEDGSLSFYQQKVNKVRTVFFSKKGLKLTADVFNKNKDIIFKKHEVLFPQPLSGRKNNDKFVSLCNKLLKPYGKKYKLTLTTHSFRIRFITEALKHSKTHQAQELAGHEDIRSTSRYNRYIMETQEKKAILNKMFEFK